MFGFCKGSGKVTILALVMCHDEGGSLRMMYNFDLGVFGEGGLLLGGFCGGLLVVFRLSSAQMGVGMMYWSIRYA